MTGLIPESHGPRTVGDRHWLSWLRGGMTGKRWRGFGSVALAGGLKGFMVPARGLASDGIDFLFPPRCHLCGDAFPEPLRPRGGGAGSRATAWISRRLCTACRIELTIDGQRCLQCGANSNGLECHGCRRPAARGDPASGSWDGVVVLGGYEADLRTAILRTKRPAGEAVMEVLAALLVERHHETLSNWSIDGIVPVPMHWQRRWRRGGSGADVMADRMARFLDVPVLRRLRRRRATPPQNSLPADKRAANVAGAFAIDNAHWPWSRISCKAATTMGDRGRHPWPVMTGCWPGHRGSVATSVSGRRLLLVDDVMTTGSTLRACSRVLRAEGAVAVFLAVVARAGTSVESAGPL